MTFRLIGDIGGTNARFALIAEGDSRPQQEMTLSCDDHADLASAVGAYYAAVGLTDKPRFAAIALATALDGDTVSFTNNHWEFSIKQTKQALDLSELKLLNDFTALALALPHLSGEDLIKVGGGEPVADAPIALIGAGTGLGVSGLIPAKGEFLPLNTEGGHCTIATFTDREHAVVREISKQFPHVSSERLLSGPGLLNIYLALCALDGVDPSCESPSDITTRALADNCSVCVETVSLFCELLGTAASNLTISLGARGGVFIGGGIAPKLGDLFLRSGFRARFENKGRFSDYMAAIPCQLIVHPNPAVVGLAAEVSKL